MIHENIATHKNIPILILIAVYLICVLIFDFWGGDFLELEDEIEY